MTTTGTKAPLPGTVVGRPTGTDHTADGLPRHGAYWQYVVLTRVAVARNDVARLRARSGADHNGLDHVEDLLATAARSASTARTWQPWLTGSAINRAFTYLHAAQVILARYTPDDDLDVRLQSAMARLKATVPWTEPRRCMLEQSFRTATAGSDCPSPANGRLKRWVLEKALEISYAATDAQYARLRSFRNVVAAIIVALLVVVVGLAVMGIVWPDALQLCFNETAEHPTCPTGKTASWRDALVIEILGATGGALAAVLTVRKMQGTSTPYGVPLALAMLKLPLGAASALVGLLLVHGRFIPGLTDLDSSGQILAYAVFLGVAQQSVTALIDRRGQDLLEQLPSKRGNGDPAGRTGPQPEEPRRPDEARREAPTRAASPNGKDSRRDR